MKLKDFNEIDPLKFAIGNTGCPKKQSGSK